MYLVADCKHFLAFLFAVNRKESYENITIKEQKICFVDKRTFSKRYTGCPKINETHKIANKYVDFNPIVYIFQI